MPKIDAVPRSRWVDVKGWRQMLARRREGRLRSPSFAEVLYTVVQHALLPLSRGAADRCIYIYIYIYAIACGLPATVPFRGSPLTPCGSPWAPFGIPLARPGFLLGPPLAPPWTPFGPPLGSHRPLLRSPGLPLEPQCLPSTFQDPLRDQ